MVFLMMNEFKVILDDTLRCAYGEKNERKLKE